MTVVQKSALVRVPARVMFALVNDVERYKEFLPWCRSSRVLRLLEDGMEAEVEVARAGFHYTFATRNTLVDEREIRMSLLRGPFESLEGVWTFTPLREDASKIALDLRFEMSGKLASLAFGKVFGQICDAMVTAFCERARELHG